MSLHRSVALALLLLLCAFAAAADQATPALETGRHDVLLDIHGYNLNGSVVVPLPPLVHWLGGTVREVRDWTAVSRGEQTIYLQFPEDRPRGLGALARVREVVEALGGDVEYQGPGSDDAAMLGHIPHVKLTDGDRADRVLLHAAPPGAVSEMLACIDGEGRGETWLLQVTALAGDWAKTHEPQWREQFGFEQAYITGVLHRVDGRWQYALRSSRVSHTPAELADAGVPLEVAQALGMEVEE